MTTCPNKNSQEWKNLVIYAGSERKAYALYIANNYNIPSIQNIEGDYFPTESKTNEQLKKERFNPIVDNINQELKRLYKILSYKQSDYAKSKDKPKLSREIQTLKNDIENLKDKLNDLAKKRSLNDITEYAEDDLARVKDILDNYQTKGLSSSDINSVVKTILLWQQAGDFSKKDHLFFTEDELEEVSNLDNEIMQEVRKRFSDWRDRADILKNKYIHIIEDILNKELVKMFGKDAKFEVDKALKDVNFLFKNMIDISEVDNQLFQLMSQWTRKANSDAHLDVQEDFKSIEAIFERIRKKGLYDTFIGLLRQKQSNTDLRETGDITYRFTQKWFEHDKEIRESLRTKLKYAENILDPVEKRNKIQKAYKEFRKDIEEMSFTIDTRKLFFDNEAYEDYASVASEELETRTNFNENDRQEYIKFLKDTLGEEGYEFYHKQLQEKLERYIEDEVSQRDDLEKRYDGDLAKVEIAMDEWKLRYSPFWNSHYSTEGHPDKKIRNNWATGSRTYITTVARKYDNKGKDLGYYDKNYEKIIANPDMKEAYDLITGLLNEYVRFLPDNEVSFFQVNTLPNLKKSIIESFSRDGMLSGMTSIWNSLKEATREDDLSKVPVDVNEKELQLNFISNNDGVIADYVDRKIIEFKQKNSKYTAKEIYEAKQEYIKEIKNELANKKSWDIERIVKAFMLHSAAFKHKSKIEDPMKMCRNMIDEIIEMQMDNNLNETYSKTSNKLKWRTDDLKNLKDMTDHFLDNFYGYRIRNKNLTKKKILNTEEKKTEKEILQAIEKNAEDFNSGLIPEITYIKNDEILQKQLKSLGGYFVWSNIGDMLIKYVQVKGIGWNVFSAFSNRGFGAIANWIEAAGGQRFSTDNLKKGTAVIHSFDPKVRKKLSALMHRFDVLKESKNEIFEQKVVTMGKRFKFLDPYKMQSSGEYMNQGEIMVAMLDKYKVLFNGEETSLWNVMNEDGSLKEGVTLLKDNKFENVEDYIFDIKSKVDEAIRRLHGNYDFEGAPLLIKKTLLGRMFSQFRTWAFMGFYDRFATGDEKESLISGIKNKGRYLSYGALYKDYSPMQATFEITKNLIRKLTFRNTQFDELVEEGKFTEEDAANLRKNLQEIVMYMIVTGIGLMLRTATEDDDDEKKDSTYKYLAVFWINQMGRLKTDIMFYTNPMEFEKLQRQALPVFNLVQDAQRLTSHGIKLMLGQTTDFYESGIYAGKRKSTRYVRQLFPFVNQFNKLESVSKQIR